MIKLAGSVHRSFVFPADYQTAFNYYRDFNRTLSFLKHISVSNRYAEGEYRLEYNTKELGLYQVRLVCDMQVEIDHLQGILRIRPLQRASAVQSKAGMYSLYAQGFYNSESIFRAHGDRTEIEYKLRLRARLPIPMGLRFMPGSVINEIARNITRWRIREIADGFIERSLRAFGSR